MLDVVIGEDELFDNINERDICRNEYFVLFFEY